jgi:hypothetical protein
MSGLVSEEILELGDAATFVNKHFRGRKPSVSTVLRWCLYGLRGVKLESIKCGGQRMTTKEAVLRFIDRLSRPQEAGREINQERAERVEQALIARGI